MAVEDAHDTECKDDDEKEKDSKDDTDYYNDQLIGVLNCSYVWIIGYMEA